MKMVSEKSGISEAQAESAVETVLDFLKEKLPAPLDKQVEQVIEKGTVDLSAGDLSDQVSGLFGRK